MTTITQQLNSATVAQAQPVQTPSQAADIQNSNNDQHGPAAIVDLSPQAQVASQPTASTSDAGAPAPAATPSTQAANDTAATSDTDDTGTADSGASAAPAGGGAGGVSFSQVSSDASTVKRRVADQVGVVEANFLVDKQGNIDQIGLDKALQAQEQADLQQLKGQG